MTNLSSVLLAIRILCIGNSFSWDVVETELVPLCDAVGVEIEIHNLYYPGCSLRQHAKFLLKEKNVYSHRVCTNDKPRRVIKGAITLRQALQNGQYDFISFQQASHDSGIRSTYEPWLTILVDTVRAYQPYSRFCWMQTWAYSQDATHFAYPRYHSNQQEMWDSILACTQFIMAKSISPPLDDNNEEHFLIIPCGMAIQNARSSRLGDTFCRDGYHLNEIYGRYTAAAVWYEILTGKNIRHNKYKNPQMTTKQRRITQKAAHKAVQIYATD